MSALKILVGVSGSIAAYKSALLVRLLIKEGHKVKVVMTPSSTEFISPLTLATLSRHDVHTNVIDENSWNNHVELGLWADLMIIAPCTANTLAAMANGLCDNMLLATYLSAKCPVWIAPAMDLDMWKHPSTQRNVQEVSTFPHHNVLAVGRGELASGLHGPGRMLEPEEITRMIGEWHMKKSSLSGTRALVTAGPTHEYIDPVRYIGNPSSGKMGIALANELVERGSRVELILGPSRIKDIHPDIHVTRVTSAREMFQMTSSKFGESDLAIFAAAVADYSPENYSESKTKKTEGPLDIRMKRTPDIAQDLGREKSAQQVTIGFALETDNAVDNAQSKLEKKRFNVIVLNTLEDKGAGFGHDTNKVTIIDDGGRSVDVPLSSKVEVAGKIIEHYVKYYHSK